MNIKETSKSYSMQPVSEVKEPIQPDYNKPTEWKQTNLKLLTSNPQLIYNGYVKLDNIPKLLESIEAKATSVSGLIQSGDVLVLTEKLLLWFSCEKKSNRKVQLGGGLLMGIWELHFDPKTSEVHIKSSKKNPENVSNYLYPGSLPGISYTGSDVRGKYQNSNVKWSIGFNDNVTQGPDFAKPIKTGDYSTSYGIYIQFQGLITNNDMPYGFESLTDTDPRPGVIGETQYTLTYRIPARRPEFQQEVGFKVLTASFGPIESLKLITYLPLYEKTNNLIYASIPQLTPDSNTKLNKEVNTYFKNSYHKEAFFYNVPKAQRPVNKSALTLPTGKALMACVGNPEDKITFLCAYPNTTSLPNYFFDQFTMKVVDNDTSEDNKEKFISMVFNVVSDKKRGLIYPEPGASLTVLRGFSMIMRYKLINTPHKYDEQYSKVNHQRLYRVLVR